MKMHYPRSWTRISSSRTRRCPRARFRNRRNRRLSSRNRRCSGERRRRDAVFALLVDSRADPTEVYKGKVAYTVSKDKETRDAFRRAMARIPDAWDWMQGARVPSALDAELEAKQAAKEAEYEAAKKEKEKERKKAQKKKKKSAAAALLAKAAEQTTASTTTTANAEKKSARCSVRRTRR